MATAANSFLSRNGAGVLVASANEQLRKRVMQNLAFKGLAIVEAQGGAEALGKLEAGDWQLLCLDRWLPDLDVQELVRTVKARFEDLDIAMVDSETGQLLLDDAQTGAPHQAENPGILRFVQNDTRMDDQAPRLCITPRLEAAESVEPLPGMIGAGAAMQRVYRMARLVAPRDTTVLITGETGTGKELVARAIHQLSLRAHRPMVVINCAAIPEELLEAELFGYVRGAFTGAVQSRIGRIHAAQDGTLFLDEVGELPLGLQAKLLRFLEYGEVQRLGSPDVFRVDVRVIAATNADLAQRVVEGRFREDLYFRLAVFPIEMPRLAEHAEDVLALAKHCLEHLGGNVTLSAAAARVLEHYGWPGNVRELQHVMERAYILAERSPTLGREHLHFTALPGGGR